MRPSENIENLVRKSRYKVDSETHERIFENVIKEIEKNKKQTDGHARPSIWSIIMKNPITKLAAAAVIIIAVLIVLNPFGSSITFAQVIEPIINARTIICDLVIGGEENGSVTHEIIVDSRIRRTMTNMPNMTLVIDLKSEKMLVLDSEAKTAFYANIKGELGNTTQSYVKFLRDTITEIRNNPDIEKLDERIINGRKAVGFIGRGPNTEVTIWADPKTAFPIQINLRIGQSHSILKNFEMGVPVDESLLSMDVPPGYALKDVQMDMGNANEKDFIESLRIWAEVLGNGIFPDSIGTERAMNDIAILGQKIGQMNIPEEQGTEMGVAFGKGMLFHQLLDNRGDDWKYVGDGVKYGDNSKAVFWYQPKGSENYRVIYGDLHVEDVSAEKLPQ
jgi:outer membrane lipoprotein-sorting protein